jgi:uncharacterized protein YjbJ (UPF0337 family)
MNRDILKGAWKQLKGKAQKQWGKLTNDELDQIDGEREQLVGKIQERYGWERDRVERELTQWLEKNLPSDRQPTA